MDILKEKEKPPGKTAHFMMEAMSKGRGMAKGTILAQVEIYSMDVGSMVYLRGRQGTEKQNLQKKETNKGIQM